jgi:hypothetical protein
VAHRLVAVLLTLTHAPVGVTTIALTRRSRSARQRLDDTPRWRGESRRRAFF